MPDPKSDADQLRFAQIRSRMLDGLVKHLPKFFYASSGATTPEELRDRITASDTFLAILDTCAYEAQCMEEERSSVGRR